MKTLNRKGFSLIELVIAVGILSAVSLGLSYSIVNVFKGQQKVVDTNNSMNFIASLGAYVQSGDYCANVLNGTPFPLNGRAPLVVNGFTGFGTAGALIQTKTVVTDSARIGAINLIHKTSVPVRQFFNGTNNVSMYVAQIEISMEMKNKGMATTGDDSIDWVSTKPSYFEFPVTVEAGVITGCQIADDPAVACAAIGGTWNGSTCDPGEACYVAGNYVTWSCTANYVDCGDSISGSTPASRISSGANGGILNPVSNALACPAGASRETTGTSERTFNVSSGKKCSYPVTESLRFNSCMICR